MFNVKSLVVGCVVGLLIGASASRADTVPPYLDVLRKIASALEKANDLQREQTDAIEDVAKGIEQCR